MLEQLVREIVGEAVARGDKQSLQVAIQAQQAWKEYLDALLESDLRIEPGMSPDEAFDYVRGVIDHANA